MTHKDTHDFLLEIGSEELPPPALAAISKSLADIIEQQLKKEGLAFKNIHAYATPRRLAVLVTALETEQASRVFERQGPHVDKAFDKEGTPTLACLSFAKSCGVLTDQLKIKKTDKGSFVVCETQRSGLSTVALLPDIVQRSLKQLPMAKPMRWGNHDILFIRPVHWVLMLFHDQVVPATILGQETGHHTYGHRFHAPQKLRITQPKEYQTLLTTYGMVIPEFKKRREKIRQGIEKAANPIGQVLLDEELLDEVTGITEWPVIHVGRFKEEFLKLPREVLITSLKMHQRCFCLENQDGKLKPYFILVSNIDSKDPQWIIAGNERVINARLSDAAFFYKNDLNHRSEQRLKKLETIIFQHGLGSLADKARRLSRLSETIAHAINESAAFAKRAGLLAKCDLASEMVVEFPTLQGTMGYYYALHDKEPEAVALAIKDHYNPRYAGDVLPESLLGVCVALADRIDHLIGIIGSNKMPSSDKDPFGCRRSALGILRLLIEKELPLDLLDLLHKSKNNYELNLPNPSVVTQTFQFIMERLQHGYLEKSVPAAVFMAVAANHPTQPLDFDRRIAAVQHFQTLPEAQALAAANKRVGHLLKKQSMEQQEHRINTALFDTEGEKTLYHALNQVAASVNLLYDQKQYTQALSTLSSLKAPVDTFFTEVMVMVDDPEKRQNRLALLAALQRLLTCVADISFLE